MLDPTPPPPTPLIQPPSSSTVAAPQTRAAARAAKVSLPTPSFQQHTLEFEIRKKEKEEKKLSSDEKDEKQPHSREASNSKSETGSLEQTAEQVSDHSLSSKVSGSSTQRKNVPPGSS